MKLDLERVRGNVREASTEDLLDRATVYRDGMEPEALEIIDGELRRRGVGGAEQAAHEGRRRQALVVGRDGWPLRCRKCPRPAVTVAWEWGKLWWLIPLFPRRVGYCEEHRPGGPAR